MTKRTLLVLLILVMLAFASYAAWQQTKTALGVGVIASPSGEGTFRLASAYCHEVIPGETGSCWIEVENQSSGTIHVDDFSVTSRNPDVVIDDVTMYRRDIGYDEDRDIDVYFHVVESASPGPFVFDVSVTCSGG